MPIYEFECEECGCRFEELASSTEVKLDCPECGSSKTRRLLSPPSLPKGPTANQRRRMEDARGTDRGGALQRFKQQRKREHRGKGNA
jgi:putative FmdB family regulatory protein